MQIESRTDEIVVLRAYASGDESLVVRAFSKTNGKFSFYAARARKKALLDVLDYGVLESVPGKGELRKLKHFTVKSAFPNLRADFDKLVLASFVVEMFDLALPQDLPEEILYQLLLDSLSKLDTAKTLQESLRVTFFCAENLLSSLGILSEKQPTSANGLLRLVAELEHYAQKSMVTRDSLISVIKSFAEK